MLNEALIVWPSEGQVIIPVLMYLGIGASQGKNPNKGHRYTEIHPKCFKLHILHQMKPYSKVKTNWELSDTCISIFGELGKSEKLGPNVLNHGHQYTESHHQVLNSTFHIKSSLPKIQIPFEGWFMPVLVYLAHWGKSGNLRPNTQIHGHVIQSVKLHISHQMKPYSSVRVILVKLYLL